MQITVTSASALINAWKPKRRKRRRAIGDKRRVDCSCTVFCPVFRHKARPAEGTVQGLMGRHATLMRGIEGEDLGGSNVA
jgi:hypothetical protein